MHAPVMFDRGSQHHCMSERVGLGGILFCIDQGRVTIHDLAQKAMILFGLWFKPYSLIFQPLRFNFFTKSNGEEWSELLLLLIEDLDCPLLAIESGQCAFQHYM